MSGMSRKEITSFLKHGTYTGKVAMFTRMGSPHVAPVWFILDEDNNNSDIIFTTGQDSLKAKSIMRDPRVSISLDDQKPPFSFVIVNGIAQINGESTDLLKLAD